MQKKKNSILYVLLLVIFLSGVSWLLYSGFTTGSVYFLNVAEAITMSPDKLQQVRLFGTVAEKDLKRDEKTLQLSFFLEDRDDIKLTIPVHYEGIVPDAFKKGAEVIVEGKMLETFFLAKTLMTKCPSKYEKQNRGSL